MKLDRIALWEERDFFSDAALGRGYGEFGVVRGVISAGNSALTADYENICVDERTLRNRFDELTVFLGGYDGGYLFRSLKDMLAYCRDRIRDHVPYSFNRECFGFRVLDEDIIWYLALTPWNDKRTFVAYGYDRTTLMAALSAERGLPEHCYGVQPYTGERIHVRFAENGIECFPQYGGNAAESRAFADEQNLAEGISAAQVSAMVGGGIFGWDTPAADIRNYDSDGKYIPPVRETISQKGEKKKK